MLTSKITTDSNMLPLANPASHAGACGHALEFRFPALPAAALLPMLVAAALVAAIMPAELNQSCSESCFSTVAYMLANHYDVRRVARELSAQAVRRLRGRQVGQEM